MRNRVRELREAAQLSQAQLGASVHVSRQTINSLETGKYQPSLTLAIRLARRFELTVEELFDVD